MQRDLELLLEQLSIEQGRLAAKIDSHQARLNELNESLNSISDSIEDLKKLECKRRHLILSRWERRKRLRLLRMQHAQWARIKMKKLPNGKIYFRDDVATTQEMARKIRQGATALPASIAKSGIYVLLKDGEIIYIGQARNILYRLGQHSGAKRFTHVTYFPVAEENLNDVERTMIDWFMPVLNRDNVTEAKRCQQGIDSA